MTAEGRGLDEDFNNEVYDPHEDCGDPESGPPVFIDEDDSRLPVDHRQDS